jgi:hypothetical protein
MIGDGQFYSTYFHKREFKNLRNGDCREADKVEKKFPFFRKTKT